MTSSQSGTRTGDREGTPDRTLYSFGDVPELRTRAFKDVESVASSLPESVLYLSRQDDDFDRVRESWKSIGTSTILRTETLDSIVDEAHEGTTYRGQTTHISEAERFRLVEATLERLDEGHPFSVEGAPGSGLRNQVEDLLSLFEFAGMQSADEVQDELNRLAAADSALAERTADFETLVTTFEEVREEWTTDRGRTSATFRSDRYAHVLTSDALERTFGHVDAVVLGPFRVLSKLERQLLKRLADCWPTVAILPRVGSGRADGVDRGVDRVRSFYRDAGFEERRAADSRTDDRTRVAAAMFQDDALGDEVNLDGVDRRVYETPSTEIRAVARDVRAALADDHEPDDVGIFLPDPSSTLPQLLETLDTYEIPATWETEVGLDETWVGRLVGDLCTVAEGDETIETVLDIVTNPLVVPEQLAAGFDPGVAVRRAETVESIRPERLVDSLRRQSEDGREAPSTRRAADRAVAGLRTTLDAVDALRGPVDSIGEALDTVLGEFGVDVEDPLSGGNTIERSREGRACERLRETANTLAAAANLFGESAGTTAVDRLQRVLTASTVSISAGRDEGCVTITDLGNAQYRQFGRSYVVGLNEDTMPTSPDRLAYVRPVNEAAEYLEPTDVALGARYALGSLLARDTHLILTRARETNDGEETVPATFLAELERVTGVESPSPTHERDEAPGAMEDVLREVATAVDAADDPLETVATLPNSFADVVPERLWMHLTAGSEAAAERAEPRVDGDHGDHYGQVDPAVVDALIDDGHAFSPSSLDRYAACGYKYLLRDVFGLTEPDEESLDPNALTQGSYIHEVLETFHRECRETGLDLPASDTPEHRRLLAAAAFDCLPTLSNHDSPFGSGWLGRVVAGLDVDDDFPLDPPAYDGLLVRFLQSEAAYGEEYDAVPELFEAAIGTGHDGDELSQDPVEVGQHPVRVRGDVDRVDTVSLDHGSGIVVHDYKSGVRDEFNDKNVTGGQFFQLPTYLLLLSEVTDYDPLAAGYYKLSDDKEVKQFAGADIGDRWARETPDELHELLSRTEERINEIDDSVRAGAFHPTFVDQKIASCEYCEFREVCDVRHHHEQDVLQSAMTADGPYVPDVKVEEADE